MVTVLPQSIFSADICLDLCHVRSSFLAGDIWTDKPVAQKGFGPQ